MDIVKKKSLTQIGQLEIIFLYSVCNEQKFRLQISQISVFIKLLENIVDILYYHNIYYNYLIYHNCCDVVIIII